MDMPDVLGYTLGGAKAILGSAGLNDLIIKTTAPPRDSNCLYDESHRVLRVKRMGETIEIIVCKPL